MENINHADDARDHFTISSVSWIGAAVGLRISLLMILGGVFGPRCFGQVDAPLASTATASVPAPAPDAPATATATVTGTTVTQPTYLLRPGDLIHISVFQEEDLTVDVRIPLTGSIMFPLLGSIQLQGKSVADCQEMIRSSLANKYIVNPHVNMTVLEYSKLWVTTLGDVKSPGKIEVPQDGRLDLLAAVALSGGFNESAETTHVSVRRRVNGQDVILNVNAKEMSLAPTAKPFMLLPEDTITVPSIVKRSATIMGEVKIPGAIALPTDGTLDLLGAIAVAGGYTADADPVHVSIRRGDTILTVNATELARDAGVRPFIIQSNDTITVKFAMQTLTILGQIRTPGKVKIPPEGGLDLLGAIALAGGFSDMADIAHITVRRMVDGKDVILSVNAKAQAHNSKVADFMVQPGDNISVPERMF